MTMSQSQLAKTQATAQMAASNTSFFAESRELLKNLNDRLDAYVHRNTFRQEPNNSSISLSAGLEKVLPIIQKSLPQSRSTVSFPVASPGPVDALKDLLEATEEAQEKDFPPPSSIAIKNSKRLIKQMYKILPQRFEVYPTQDGEIAIHVSNGQGEAVLLLCDSEGGALCLVQMKDDQMKDDWRRARYTKTKGLPDGFVSEALNDLKISFLNS